MRTVWGWWCDGLDTLDFCYGDGCGVPRCVQGKRVRAWSVAFGRYAEARRG